MIEVKSLENSDYKYIIQTPDQLEANKHLVVVALHGSIVGTYEDLVEQVRDEYERGRWQFPEETAARCIFVTPVIPYPDDQMRLSNGLEVNSQCLFRGSVHRLCKTEFPHMYAPQIPVAQIIDNVTGNFAGYLLDSKVIMVGLSAGGSFATRFGLIYPHKLAAVLSMLSDDVTIPLEGYQGLQLPFPIGIAGLDDCPSLSITAAEISAYVEIPKLIVVDSDDDRVREHDALWWEIDQEFYDAYTNIFGVRSYERAFNRAKFLNAECGEHIETVITKGEGHNISDEDFDAHIQRYILKIARQHG